jgi:hypothetical protein
MTEANIGKAPEKEPDAVKPVNDGLTQYRSGEAQLTPAVYTSTAGDHLPLIQVADNGSDVPFNPKGYAGTYNPQDIAVANQHFSKQEVRALEEAGPQNFNQMMEAIKNAPAAQSEQLVKTFKTLADIEIQTEQTNPKMFPNKA